MASSYSDDPLSGTPERENGPLRTKLPRHVFTTRSQLCSCIYVYILCMIHSKVRAPLENESIPMAIHFRGSLLKSSASTPLNRMAAAKCPRVRFPSTLSLSSCQFRRSTVPCQSRLSEGFGRRLATRSPRPILVHCRCSTMTIAEICAKPLS